MINSNLTILLIDHNSDYACEVQNSLAKRTDKKVKVVVQPDLTKALAEMSKQEFDVVLARRDALDSMNTVNDVKGNFHPIVGILQTEDYDGHDGHDGDADGRNGSPTDFLVKLPVQADVLTQLILSTIEKYQLRASLESTENDLRKLIERNADSIIVVDRQGALLFWNKAAQELFGNSELGAGEQFGIPLIAGETTELDIVGHSGERIVTEMRVVDIEWNQERAHLATLRDVTQRKLTEEDLEKKVKERTEQLEKANDELQKLYDSASKAAQVRSQFIANFSHEVRTPLGGVVAAAELLPMADNLEEYKELANQVFASSKQLLSLVESILDFSKLESGSVPIVETEFSVREMFDSILQSVSKLADDNGVEIRHEIATTIPDVVRGDEVKMRQVMLNFAHNAIKFTKNGTVAVKAEFDDEHKDKQILKISVKDSGIGMSPAECEAIFQPFVQGNRRIYGSFGGTGLGLSICKQLVRAMDGHIDFCSEQGKGSTFWFTVPIKETRAN